MTRLPLRSAAATGVGRSATSSSRRIAAARGDAAAMIALVPTAHAAFTRGLGQPPLARDGAMARSQTTARHGSSRNRSRFELSATTATGFGDRLAADAGSVAHRDRRGDSSLRPLDRRGAALIGRC